VLFPLEEEARLMHEHGMLLRRTVQFHWRNEGYRDFDDFLARLSHARRKNIRQERRRVAEAGVALRWLEGAAIERRHWEFFNRCYRSTYAAHRSSPYLNLQFFLRIGAKLPENLAMVLAEREGRPIASALFLTDSGTSVWPLLGRDRARAAAPLRMLLLPPIEFAIERGIAVFEGGAQGEHKLFRGLMPVETLSAHWLAHPRFSRAVKRSSSARARACGATSTSCATIALSRHRRTRCGSRTSWPSSPARAPDSAPASRAASPRRAVAWW
jgi:predicted N-acyltransferase